MSAIGPLLGWLGLLSMTTFLLSILLIPWIVGRLSPDCFLRLSEQGKDLHKDSSITLLLLLRNLLGLLLVVAGILMLFLPGQGLLTILIGLFLLSFPGKKKIICQLIALPKVRKSMDWLRKISGKAAFIWPA
jgi:uncharacterized protein YjeT (DUF2065 family)